MRHWCPLLLVLCFLSQWSGAHEIRPGYLSMSETDNGYVSVLWKVPTRGEAVLALAPVFPPFCERSGIATQRLVPGALVRESTLVCSAPLQGAQIAIDGLDATLTDVLLRIVDRYGSTHTERLTPARSAYTVPVEPSRLDVANTYLLLGAEHILLGVDHLLFVLGLLLLVDGTRRLAITATAFTLAHSMTLAVATLGYVRIEQAPVEAVIALSILFLATEIIYVRRGKGGLAANRPWLLAFAFGLLHGLGFAGALAAVGLPTNAIPLALLFFNIGVEIGQLAFISAVLVLVWMARRQLGVGIRSRFSLAVTYAIGALAAYWTLLRVSVL